MILMALDHVRDYFGAAGINPTNPATTTVPLFFTRWITHFCAPTFFLLTGTGAYLSLRRRGAVGLSRFLVTRGLWLLLLDVVVLRCLAWQFNFDFRVTLLIVLWALGWAMITLAVLVRWPPRVAAIFGIVLIVGHNLLDGISPPSLGALRPIWLILHQPGLLFAAKQHFVIVAYPLIPWVGVTAVGYALGQCFEWDAARRRSFLWRTGLSLVVAFVALRALNIYGDPARWAAQQSNRSNVPIVPQHDEVSAIAAVSAHDSRPRAAVPARGRRSNPELAAPGDRLWPRTALLLCDARRGHPPVGGRRALVPVRCGALGVRVVDARSISICAAAGVACGAAHRVRHLDWRRCAALATLPVVRPGEGGTPGLVVELSVANGMLITKGSPAQRVEKFRTE